MLLTKKVTVSAECTDFVDIFLEKLVAVLPKQIGINEHAIELVEGKPPPYRPIYSLKPVGIKILKTQIEINLANGFQQLLKFPADTLILFVHKSDGSLHLCINYQGLNNLTVKNQYPSPLIGESLDQ